MQSTCLVIDITSLLGRNRPTVFDGSSGIVYSTGMSEQASARGVSWDSRRIQALRKHLGLTQQEFSRRLGTRQQTISEWETGMYQPRGASTTLLSIVAERAGFSYEAAPENRP
jgi:DNA-binding transcriptional regulator YiaG